MENEANSINENLSFNIADEIEFFRRNNDITLNQISVKSGISVTNLKRMLYNEKDISVLALVRIVNALWDKGIVDFLFKDRPKYKKSLYPTVQKPDICTVTDYTALIILLWDYFLNQTKYAEDKLKTVYRALEAEISIIESGNAPVGGKDDTYFYNYISVPAKDRYKDRDGLIYTDSEEYKVDKSVLDIHLKSYFDETFFVPTFISDTNPMFTLKAEDYRPLMLDGETMVWSDVTNALTQYRADNNLLLKDLKTGEIIHRMENKKSHAYKYNDVMAIDDELTMGGTFFCICYTATRNSVLLGKICSMMDSGAGNIKKKSDQKRFELGIDSFFGMLRYLEKNKDINNSPYKVLNVLRSVCFYMDESQHYKWLKQAVTDFPEFYPENPLEFYDKLPQ